MTNSLTTRVSWKIGMFKPVLMLSLMLIAGVACDEHQPDAETIIARSLEAHGGDAYNNMDLGFTFRNARYRVERSNGIYEYSRNFTDTLGRAIEDVLNNDGFERLIDGELQELDERRYRALRNSVNSVVYFAMLPHPLRDPAVRLELAGNSTMNGKSYWLIKVTFEEEGGDDDHDDVFYYWISKDGYFVDFMAYTFTVNQGGMRFREAFNRRTVHGLVVQDYYNYKAVDPDAGLEDLEKLYRLEGGLELVSEIVHLFTDQ